MDKKALELRLFELAERCENELRIIGIEIAENITYSVNYRALQRWGQTRIRDGNYSININYLLLENYSEKGARNTIFHELLHTVKGCMNHGEKWQRLANLVNDCYAMDIKRTSTCEEKGLLEVEIPRKIKYVFRCQKCGQIINMERASKFTRNYKKYSCGYCKGKFEMIEG